MKYFGYAVLFFIIYTVVYIVGTALGFFGNAVSNVVDTGHGVIDKTLNADNAIYNYEWFKQQKQDIEVGKGQYQNALQTEDAFKASAGDRKDWTWDDKQEASRLASITLGLKNQIIQRTEDYNARAKMANRDIFRDGLLPDALEFGAGFLK